MWNACCHHNSWLVSDFLITWYETQTKREREWEWNKSGKVLIYVHIFTYALNCNDTKGANKLLKKHCIGDRERKRERRRSNILQISCKHQIEYCWRLNASFVQDRIERERVALGWSDSTRQKSIFKGNCTCNWKCDEWHPMKDEKHRVRDEWRLDVITNR